MAAAPRSVRSRSPAIRPWGRVVSVFVTKSTPAVYNAPVNHILQIILNEKYESKYFACSTVFLWYFLFIKVLQFYSAIALGVFFFILILTGNVAADKYWVCSSLKISAFQPSFYLSFEMWERNPWRHFR